MVKGFLMSVLSLFTFNVNNSQQPPHFLQGFTRNVKSWKVPNLSPFHGTGRPCWIQCGHWWHTVVCSDYLAVCFWLPAATGSVVDQFQDLLNQFVTWFVTWTPKTIKTGQNYPVKFGRQHEDDFSCHSAEIPKQTIEVQISQLRYWDLQFKPGLLIRRRALQDKALDAMVRPFLLTAPTIL